MKSSVTYKQTLQEARVLRGQSGRLVYQRVKLLIQVFRDDDFRIDNGDLDDDRLARVLDAEVSDLCCSFLELMAMIEFAPNVEQWETGDLNKLKLAMLDHHIQMRKESSPSRPPRRTATVKEVEVLEGRVEEVAAEKQKVEIDLQESLSLVDRLRAENEELRRKLDRAEGRIEELERQLKRDVAAV